MCSHSILGPRPPFTHITEHTQMRDAQAEFCHTAELKKMTSLIILHLIFLSHTPSCLSSNHLNFHVTIIVALHFMFIHFCSYPRLSALFPSFPYSVAHPSVPIPPSFIPLHPAFEGRGRYERVGAQLY